MKKIIITASLAILSTASWASETPLHNPYFSKGKAEIKVTINGRDSLGPLDNLLVYYTNPFTGENSPKVAASVAEGVYAASVEMEAPGYVSIGGFNNLFLPYYAEPGRSLEITYDWKDLAAHPPKWGLLPPAQLGGDLGEVNEALCGAPVIEMLNCSKLADSSTPSEVTKAVDDCFERNTALIEKYISSREIPEKAAAVLRNNVRGEKLRELLTYASELHNMPYFKPEARSLSEPITLDFFDFVREVMAENDPSIISSLSGNSIVNQMGFADLDKRLGAPKVYRFTWIDPGFVFLKELGAKFTPEQEETARYVVSRDGTSEYVDEDQMEKYNQMRSETMTIAEQNGMTQQLIEYLTGLDFSNMEVEDMRYNLKRQGEALKAYAGTASVPLLWQCAVSSGLCTFGKLNKDKCDLGGALEVVDNARVDTVFTEPNIINSATAFFTDYYGKLSTPLPDDERGRIMADIIAPYRGKYVLVDFWGTYCAPCRAEIESSVEERERNREHPDFKMIFITGADNTPEDAFREYSGKYLAGETSLRLPASDYNLLSDLFGINAIPRHLLFDREGKIVSTNLRYHSLSQALATYGIELR